MTTNPDTGVDNESSLRNLELSLTGDTFSRWRREQKFRENIRNNNPEYNKGGNPVEELTHHPHKVGFCHRKIWYREQNAPHEMNPPDGIFYLGTHIEKEIVGPWIASIAEEHGLYEANCLWLEANIESTNFKIKGSTDPVICDSNGVPLLITEVKTKESLTKLERPTPYHKAQLMGYQHAAHQEYEIPAPIGYLLYVGKKRFDLKAFEVEYDDEFFQDYFVHWAEVMSRHRIEKELPPASPQHDWECNLCEFKERCGQGETHWEDVKAGGFLPLYSYPKEAVHTYMQAHPNETITPTIAREHPELSERFSVAEWVCTACNTTHPWDGPDWDEYPYQPPICPSCTGDEGHPVELTVAGHPANENR